MKIVLFEPKYKKAVLELNEFSVSSSEYIGKTVSPAWHNDLERINEIYFGNKGAFLLWLDGGKLVGMGGFLKQDAHTAFIKRIRVHPDFQRKGLSAQILTELEKRAIALGYRRLEANTAKGNVPAEKMLLKAGFTQIGEKEYFGVLCTLFEKPL